MKWCPYKLNKDFDRCNSTGIGICLITGCVFSMLLIFVLVGSININNTAGIICAAIFLVAVIIATTIGLWCCNIQDVCIYQGNLEESNLEESNLEDIVINL